MKLFSILGKNRTVNALKRFEDRIIRLLSPSDLVVVGVFFALAILGTGILFATTSMRLSEAVPVRGGTHIEGVVGSPRFINPLLALSDTDNDVASLVFGGLMRSGPNGELTPYLAESYTVSPDGLIYTFTLKDSATFHDGAPLRAEDVVFTVSKAKNPEIKSPRRANWEGVEVVALDERTIQFSLREPYGLFLENTTLGILPKHLWESVSAEEFPFSDLNTHPIGSGLYRIDSIKKNASGVPSSYKLVAAKTTDIRPFIKSFIFRFYPNQDALAEALIGGEIDAAYSIIPDEKTLKGHTLEEAVFARIFGVFFNQNQQELFTDEIVRIALDESLDKKSIIDTVISGYGTVLTGPLPPEEVVDVVDEIGAEERLQNARDLLIEYGWTEGEDGVFEKGSDDTKKRLSFTLTTGNARELKVAAEAVAETWRLLGAEVSVQFFDQNDLNLEVIRPRAYDALLFGLVVGRELDLFAFWHSSQRNDPGLNIALYASITADSHLEKARNELDPAVRRTEARDAAEEIANDTAGVFLYAPHFTYVHETDLYGIDLSTVSTPSDRFAGVEEWYIHTENVWPVFIR